MSRRSLIVLLQLWAVGAALSQGPFDPNEGSRVSYDSATGICHLSWWGEAGSFYFIQSSTDLLSWTYFPGIAVGSGAIAEMNFTTDDQTFFVRLQKLDDPTGTDSDGDGLSDGFEVLNGLRPDDPSDALADRDNDGRSNLEEFNAGTDLSDPAPMIQLLMPAGLLLLP